MKYISIIFILVFIFFATSRDSDELWRDGNYVVAWIDSDVFLAYGEPEDAFYGLVGAEVIAVGHNTNYVIAKKLEPTSKELSFYVIDKVVQKSNSGIVFSQTAAVKGPYSKTEFDNLSKELQLPSFTEEF